MYRESDITTYSVAMLINRTLNSGHLYSSSIHSYETEDKNLPPTEFLGILQ